MAEERKKKNGVLPIMLLGGAAVGIYLLTKQKGTTVNPIAEKKISTFTFNYDSKFVDLYLVGPEKYQAGYQVLGKQFPGYKPHIVEVPYAGNYLIAYFQDGCTKAFKAEILAIQDGHNVDVQIPNATCPP